MKYLFSLILLFAATALFAQEKNPVTSAVKEILPRQQKNLVAAAEEMPAVKYTYKPTEQQMTFGHLVLHVVESNNYFCSKVGDQPEVKAAVALKESFEFCTTALNKVDDGKLADEVELFGGRKGSRAFGLFALTNSWSDHY